MEINTSSSTKMDSSEWQGYEQRVIRIPKAYRKALNFSLNEFISLRNKLGGVEVLQIAEAFSEDVQKSQECAYVTSVVHRRLFKTKGYQTEVEAVKGIMFGCDPEAFLIDKYTGAAVGAYRFMKKWGEVGNDGMLLEFRPRPSLSVEAVVREIYNLILRGHRIIRAKPGGDLIRIVGGSSYQGLTAGFHLHYGLPRAMLGQHPNNRLVARLMTAAFDYYVGVPSIIPEGNRDITRRVTRLSPYGKPGGYRLDSRTFEFRLPGGINMVHPVLSIGLMALGAVVAEDVVSRINTCTDCFSSLGEISSEKDIGDLYPNLPDAGALYSIICNSDIGPARKNFELIKTDVRQMVGYTERAESVERYFKCIESDTAFSNDIMSNWGGFYNEKQQGQVAISQSRS